MELLPRCNLDKPVVCFLLALMLVACTSTTQELISSGDPAVEDEAPTVAPTIQGYPCEENCGEESEPVEEPDPPTEPEEECDWSMICYADYPCGAESFCDEGNSVTMCETLSCEAVCGTSCCTGASCQTSGHHECRDGTVCMERNLSIREAACKLPEEEGDPSEDYGAWHLPYEGASRACVSG